MTLLFCDHQHCFNRRKTASIRVSSRLSAHATTQILARVFFWKLEVLQAAASFMLFGEEYSGACCCHVWNWIPKVL